MDMQDEARNAAMKGGLAEGVSTVNMAYGAVMLSNGGTATTPAVVTRATGNRPESTDFEYTFTAVGTGVKVLVSAKTGGAVANATAVSKTWPMP
jgi:hypothetical protein